MKGKSTLEVEPIESEADGAKFASWTNSLQKVNMVAVKQQVAHGVISRSDCDQNRHSPLVLSGLCFHGNLARPSLQLVPAQDRNRDQRAC